MKGQVVFNSEDDLHDANLAVGRTLDFALRNNTPAPAALPLKDDGTTVPTLKEYDEKSKEDLLRILGLTHTHDTKVGDACECIERGFFERAQLTPPCSHRRTRSFGRRAQACLHRRGPHQPRHGPGLGQRYSWTRCQHGLGVRQDHAHSHRRQAQLDSRFTLPSWKRHLRRELFRLRDSPFTPADQLLVQLFDKVLVIAEGETLYYGPRGEAKKYMEDLGFECLGEELPMLLFAFRIAYLFHRAQTEPTSPTSSRE